jgi:RNA polymerase-binding transcription factor DksA
MAIGFQYVTKNLFMKTCNKCKIEKPLSEFNYSMSHGQSRIGHCKDCGKKIKKERVKKIKEGTIQAY